MRLDFVNTIESFCPAGLILTLQQEAVQHYMKNEIAFNNPQPKEINPEKPTKSSMEFYTQRKKTILIIILIMKKKHTNINLQDTSNKMS